MNIIRKETLEFAGSRLAKEGLVLAVRAWTPASFYEIDLHLPDEDMSNWLAVQHIKVRVAPNIYRDYTPTLWDEETRTCTLCINTTAGGPGSLWAASLHRGDKLVYAGLSSAMDKPAPGKRILCIGDNSGVGHFLALRQLAAGTSEIIGAVSFGEHSHLGEFSSYFDSGLEPILEKQWDCSLASWLDRQELDDEAVYIAGHIPTAQLLQKQLQERDDFNGTIRVRGFWN